MGRMYPSVDPVNVQRRVTIFGIKTQKSPDDPVHGGVGRSDVIGGVSQRGVSFELAHATPVG